MAVGPAPRRCRIFVSEKCLTQNAPYMGGCSASRTRHLLYSGAAGCTPMISQRAPLSLNWLCDLESIGRMDLANIELRYPYCRTGRRPVPMGGIDPGLRREDEGHKGFLSTKLRNIVCETLR